MPDVTYDTGALARALEETAADHGPGLFGLVTDGGEVVYAGSVGTADLDAPRPIGADDQFRIGSVTKTYVTALVLQLAAEGAFALDDPVERWLPGLVPDSDGITVDLLLRLRSGLPDYVGVILGEVPDLGALRRYWAPEELVRAALTAPDRLPPDTEHRYTNTDYVLLGLVAERATGQRVDALLWRRMLEPLGLRDTTLPAVDPRLRGPHARGYLRFSAEMPYVECTELSPSQAWTAGGIVATAPDVARFFEALLGGGLVADPVLARMTDGSERLDAARGRGPGLIRYAIDGAPPAYGQQGGVPGYTCAVLRSVTGRCVVLWQNGYDAHATLPYDTPFVLAALRS